VFLFNDNQSHFLTFKKILFQIPATIFSKLVPPQVFVATAATGWVEGGPDIEISHAPELGFLTVA